MRKTFFLFLLLCLPTSVFSQSDGDNLLKAKKEKPPIVLYKIISAQRDTTYLDTSLSLQKEYKFNYLRKDNFELQEFSNVGQPYNKLAYDFNNLNLKPLFVAQSHHFGYREVEDMEYFNLPTPLTELYLVYDDACQILQSKGVEVTKSLVGNYCTSLEMQGASITLLKCDEEILKNWDAPVHTAAMRWGM